MAKMLMNTPLNTPSHSPLLTLRQILFATLFYTSLFVLGAMGMPMLLLPRFIALGWMRCWLWLTFTALRVIVGLRYEFKGTEHLPPGGSIFAAKHQSAFDTFVFLQREAKVAYIMKKELFWVPVYGWFSKKVGMIGVDRSGHSRALRDLLKATKAAVTEGRRIIIFPQGTRTHAGSGKPYQPGIYAIYRDSGLPITPIALNSGEFWPKSWLKRYPGTITIEFLPPIPAGLSRHDLMKKLETEIETASLKLAGQGPAAHPSFHQGKSVKAPEHAAPH